VEGQNHSQFGMVCVKGVPLLPLCLSCTLGLVIDRWLSRCVEVQFKLGGKLVGERTNSFILSECLFADAAVLGVPLVEKTWFWLPGYLIK